MPVAAAVVGSAVIGGVASNMAASKAAKASQKATDASIAAQQQQAAQTRADEAPYTQAGYGALNSLTGRLGVTPQNSSGQVIGAPTAAQTSGAAASPAAASLPAAQSSVVPYAGGAIGLTQQPGGSYAAPSSVNAMTGQPATLPAQAASGATPGATPAAGAATSTASQGYTNPGDFSYTLDDYTASPAYAYQLDQALKGTQASAAATGALQSGAAAKALQDRAQNMALTDFNNERAFQAANFDTDRAFQRGVYQDDTSNLFNLANLGQSAASQTAASGQNTTNGVVNALGSNATNQGNAAIAGANSLSSLLGTGVNALAYNAAKTPSLASAVTAGVNANPLLY